MKTVTVPANYRIYHPNGCIGAIREVLMEKSITDTSNEKIVKKLQKLHTDKDLTRGEQLACINISINYLKSCQLTKIMWIWQIKEEMEKKGYPAYSKSTIYQALYHNTRYPEIKSHIHEGGTNVEGYYIQL